MEGVISITTAEYAFIWKVYLKIIKSHKEREEEKTKRKERRIRAIRLLRNRRGSPGPYWIAIRGVIKCQPCQYYPIR